MIAALLFTLATAGVLFMAVRFARTDVPLDYHAKILAKEGGAGDGLMLILRALYRLFACALFGAAVLMLYVIWTDVVAGSILAALVITVAGLGLGVVGTILPKAVEDATGVRTPWRISAISTVPLVLGFVASILP
jgi:hypothetical protein